MPDSQQHRRHQVSLSEEEAKNIMTEIMGIIGEAKTREVAEAKFQKNMGFSSAQVQAVLNTNLFDYGISLHLPCEEETSTPDSDNTITTCIRLVDPALLIKKLTEIFNMA